MDDFTLDRYRGSKPALRNGFRDQYPGVPLGEEAYYQSQIDEAEMRIRDNKPLSAIQEIIMTAHSEAAALPEGERATTELIERWLQGGHVSHRGYIFGRHSIVYIDSRSTCVAVRYEGKIAYLWGGMPGHRFPDDAVGYTLDKWEKIVSSLKNIRSFDSMSIQSRKHTFGQYLQVTKNLPPWTRLSKVSNLYGQEGLLQELFGHRFAAAIVNPDMQFIYGLPHVYLKSPSEARFSIPKGDTYALMTTEDALEVKMRSAQPVRMIDLTRKLEV